MFCEISGVEPEEPVLSRKSGYLFERRLILKALASSGGKCPISGEDLSEDDLVAVRVSGSNAQPLPATAASIPGLLTHVRNEWDAMVLEAHRLKQLLASTRQELAHALYQYDAATRVIARLSREKEEVSKAVNNHLLAETTTLDNTTAPVAMESEAVANGSSPGPGKKVDIENSRRRIEGKIVERAESENVVVAGQKRDLVEPDVADAGNAPIDGDSRNEADSTVEMPSSGAVGDIVLKGEVENDAPMKLPSSSLEKIEKSQAVLTATRRARTVSPSLATVDHIRLYDETHRSETAVTDNETQNDRGYVCAAQYRASPDEDAADSPGTLAVGCSDGAIRVLSAADLSSGGIGAPSAHAGGVTVLAHSHSIHPSLLFSGGCDGMVRGWTWSSLQADSPPIQTPSASTRSRASKRRRSSAVSDIPPEATATVSIGEPDDVAVTGVSLHPAGDLILSSLSGGSWRLHDVEQSLLLSSGVAADAAGIECCAVHPDGGIFGVGTTTGVVEIWDVKQMKKVEALGADVVPAGSASSIYMSENGYYMVVCGKHASRVWDLRHLKIAREASLYGVESKDFTSSGFALDWSGKYLACAIA
jgi:hypothetical protein